MRAVLFPLCLTLTSNRFATALNNTSLMLRIMSTEIRCKYTQPLHLRDWQSVITSKNLCKRKQNSTARESFVANKNNLKLAETDLINYNADPELHAQKYDTAIRHCSSFPASRQGTSCHLKERLNLLCIWCVLGRDGGTIFILKPSRKATRKAPWAVCSWLDRQE